MHDREKKKTRRDSGSYDRDQVNCQRFNSQSEGTRNLPSLPPRARFCRLRLCQRDGPTTCHDNTVKINVEFESSELLSRVLHIPTPRLSLCIPSTYTTTSIVLFHRPQFLCSYSLLISSSFLSIRLQVERPAWARSKKLH